MGDQPGEGGREAMGWYGRAARWVWVWVCVEVQYNGATTKKQLQDVRERFDAGKRKIREAGDGSDSLSAGEIF